MILTRVSSSGLLFFPDILRHVYNIKKLQSFSVVHMHLKWITETTLNIYIYKYSISLWPLTNTQTRFEMLLIGYSFLTILSCHLLILFLEVVLYYTSQYYFLIEVNIIFFEHNVTSLYTFTTVCTWRR